MLTKNEEAKLSKLGLKSLSDLILFVPKNYESNMLSKELIIGQENVIEVELRDFKQDAKRYLILGYMPYFKKEIEIVFFNYKPYIIDALKQNSKHYLKGKVEARFNLQLIQPKIVNEIDSIKCIYPKCGLKYKTIRELIIKYINRELLNKLAIPDRFIEPLLTIHFPNSTFFNAFKQNNGFFGIYLEALKFCEIYFYLKKLSQKRIRTPALNRLEKSPLGFISSLPFKLTNDQKRVIEEIHNDLKSDIAAKRVIVGDVGCGKTIIILASAYIACSKRSILMVPTTILANQIYEEAIKFLPKDMKIALLTQESQKESIADAHFIIGTHALLYANLKDISLVMVDEQHRFGTYQREALSKFFEKEGKKPHFLQFSATPIPRTLALIESSLVDISLIRELPFKRNIKTEIIDKSHFKSLIAHIKSQIEKNRQIAIIYPLVERSDNIDYLSMSEAECFWKKHFNNVYIAHGKDRDKIDVLLSFRDNGDILLATTLIEVGISLPRLSTIVIVGAERLGLATLHQLRGRVGRYGDEGFCFLYTNNPKNQRLIEFANTQNGFEIAELDLKYRNSGDILNGVSQSGKSFKWIDLAFDEAIVKEAKELVTNTSLTLL